MVRSHMRHEKGEERKAKPSVSSASSRPAFHVTGRGGELTLQAVEDGFFADIVDVDLIVDSADKHLSTVLTPADSRRWNPSAIELNDRIPPFDLVIPHTNNSIITTRDNEFPASSTGSDPIDRVNDAIVSPPSTSSLTSREVGHGDRGIGRASVERWAEEGELEVEDGCFVSLGQESGVGMRRVGLPKGDVAVGRNGSDGLTVRAEAAAEDLGLSEGGRRRG